MLREGAGCLFLLSNHKGKEQCTQRTAPLGRPMIYIKIAICTKITMGLRRVFFVKKQTGLKRFCKNKWDCKYICENTCDCKDIVNKKRDCKDIGQRLSWATLSARDSMEPKVRPLPHCRGMPDYDWLSLGPQMLKHNTPSTTDYDTTAHCFDCFDVMCTRTVYNTVLMGARILFITPMSTSRRDVSTIRSETSPRRQAFTCG